MMTVATLVNMQGILSFWPNSNYNLANIHIVIDKMHMAGHVDKWCKANCDPQLYDDLKEVRSYEGFIDIKPLLIKCIYFR